MTRQCAWCKTILGQTSHGNEGGVTHGICAVCSMQMLRQAGRIAANVRGESTPRCEAPVEPLR